MTPDHDFTALRALLSEQRLRLPSDTEINRFLIEFHRRQRVQLLARETVWSRAFAWIKERVESFQFVPSLSYTSGFAAIAVMAFLGFTQQVVQVSHVDGQYKLSLRAPNTGTSFALLPVSFTKPVASPSDNMTFTSSAKPDGTRFILSSPRVAYDATVAF